MQEKYIDRQLLRRFEKEFNLESYSDLILPYPSSSVKIVVNTALGIISAGFWAKGFGKLNKLNTMFPLKFIGFFSAYCLTHNISKEFFTFTVEQEYGKKNIAMANLASSLFTFTLFLPLRNISVLRPPLCLWKLSFHYYLFSLYWDIGCELYKRIKLDKENRTDLTYLFK